MTVLVNCTDVALNKSITRLFTLELTWVSSHTLMKSSDTSNRPSTWDNTIRVGILAMKKKYAICAANPV